MKYSLDAYLASSVPQDPKYHYLQSPFGTLRYQAWGDPKKPALVSAPDGPAVIEHFKALASQLEQEYYLVVFDLPGFGGSSPSSDYKHTIQEGCEVIHFIMSALHLEKAHLCFTCINGFYALEFAKHYPQKTLSLLLGQTPSFQTMRQWTSRVIPKILMIPYVGQVMSYLLRFKFAKIWFKKSLGKMQDASSWEAMSTSNLNQGGCFCLASLVQTMIGTKINNTNADLLKDIPIHMIWGQEDRTHRFSDPQTWLKHAPNAHIHVWSNTGHFPPLEDPKAFHALLKKIPS